LRREEEANFALETFEKKGRKKRVNLQVSKVTKRKDWQKQEEESDERDDAQEKRKLQD
jgi:hypothetical protein